MRPVHAALVLALFAAAAARADPPAPPADPDVVAARADLARAMTAIVEYYPAGAKAAGVEGWARLSCRRTLHAALVGCSLDAESPGGEGFGEAALAIAARSTEDPALDAPAGEVWTPREVTFSFRLTPLSIEPNLLLAHAIAPIAWFGDKPCKETSCPAIDYYPARAARLGVAGKAVLDCLIQPDGSMTDCEVAAEDPPGFEFGRSALRLSTQFHVGPRGAPAPPAAAWRRIVFPLHFNPPKPTPAASDATP
jgi:TonB family protein